MKRRTSTKGFLNFWRARSAELHERGLSRNQASWVATREIRLRAEIADLIGRAEAKQIRLEPVIRETLYPYDALEFVLQSNLAPSHIRALANITGLLVPVALYPFDED